MDRVLARLTPDNLRPRSPRIIAGAGSLIGILNPSDDLPVRGESVCLGALFGPGPDWWRPGADAPDGSYALFRGDGSVLDLVSDIVGSRTIWYAQTEELFIAATSQRAIVCFLQSFEPNEAVYPWMLSSGTLGPGLSWDRRIRCLGPDTRLRLDRRTWEVRIEQVPVEFKPENLPRAEHERRLRQALEETFAWLKLDLAQWVLPLSGGYDSRAILLLLKERAGLTAVTWGLKSALEDKQSDAWVARELVRHFGLAHEYYETDLSAEPIDQIFERYLVAGEGRVDHISGYMDGFAIWRRLHESGRQGILRGDVAFGCRAVQNDRQVYHNMSATVLEDFGNLAAASTGCGLHGQKRPGYLERRLAETRAAWRDRLNLEFEIPYVFAGLSDLKLPYVEVIQPLMSRRIVETVRAQTDELRTGKSLFKSIVTGRGPRIGYAGRAAIEQRGDILRNPAVAGAIHRQLRNESARPDGLAVLSRCALRLMEEGRAHEPQNDRALSARVLRWARRLAKTAWDAAPRMDPYRFGFRAYIITRMDAVLRSDAEALDKAMDKAGR
jgi:hypothetical protein